VYCEAGRAFDGLAPYTPASRKSYTFLIYLSYLLHKVSNTLKIEGPRCAADPCRHTSEHGASPTTWKHLSLSVDGVPAPYPYPSKIPPGAAWGGGVNLRSQLDKIPSDAEEEIYQLGQVTFLDPNGTQGSRRKDQKCRRT
jgi:hypothetical protein